jgi:predicted nucleic acid-binding protein
MPNVFVDTNVLVYAADESTPISRKTTIAREILLLPGVQFSVQVLNEFIAASRRPNKLNLTRERERRWLEGWLLRPVSSLTKQTFLKALALHTRFRISHWDSLIVAAALETGCETIYSEDLSHGQDYDGVKVINPFR